MKTISFTIVSILSLACLSSCTMPAESYEMYFDPSLTNAQINIMKDAAIGWETVVPVHFSFHGTDRPCNSAGDHHNICMHPSTTAYLSATYSDLLVGTSVLEGVTFRDGADNSDVYVGSDMNDGKYKTVSMHELGHALGLHHNPQENTLMYGFYGINQASFVTCSDAKSYNDIRGLDTFCSN